MPIDGGPSKIRDLSSAGVIPRCVAYHADSAFGSRAFRKTPPIPVALAMVSPLLFPQLNDLIEFGFMFGLAAGAWGVIDHSRGFGLPYAFARVGLYRLGG